MLRHSIWSETVRRSGFSSTSISGRVPSGVWKRTSRGFPARPESWQSPVPQSPDRAGACAFLRHTRFGQAISWREVALPDEQPRHPVLLLVEAVGDHLRGFWNSLICWASSAVGHVTKSALSTVCRISLK